MELVTITTPGLGDNSYVVAHGGNAVVIDPQRDIERFLAAADDLGVIVAMVCETHVHNDYVSGAPALADTTGAELVLPAGSEAAFSFRPAFHHDDIAVDGLTLRPVHTPGHTPEHVSYVVLIDGEPVCVFSGGSLLVGAVGRTDLLGSDRSESLARLQFGSIHRLASLPDAVAVYPTHGSGSFCAASAVGEASSTIGVERSTNRVMGLADADAFAADQLRRVERYPSYYRHLGPINRSRPGPIPTDLIPALSPAEVTRLIDNGVAVVDTRPAAVAASGRLPGSWAIELGDSFATWVGWLLPFAAPLVLVLDDPDELTEARTALARVGFTDIAGVLWGVERWAAEDHPVVAHRTMTPEEFATAGVAPSQVLDVRARSEWEGGHVAGSVHRYLVDLAESVPDDIDADQPVYVGCASGSRASVAAGLLADAGYEPVVLVGGSIPDLVAMAAAAAQDRNR
ncbi:MAG: rhodanese-like domain-containing protein [Actinomycetota bacterium]|nr:rhodanese-like domain-containing protein [Actinomycetota bacterium]